MGIRVLGVWGEGPLGWFPLIHRHVQAPHQPGPSPSWPLPLLPIPPHSCPLLPTRSQDLGKELSDEEYKEALRLLDTSKNGFVEFDEFCAWCVAALRWLVVVLGPLGAGLVVVMVV